jgi:organic hydroperoxide reductase OsmC/OhrA
MGEYNASVTWERNGARFTDNRYSRAHRWTFDGGLNVPASSSPHVVPIPLSDPGGVDSEEAFVAALSSCHMLWFLSVAAKGGFTVDSYRDDAVGCLEKNPEGRLAITRVTLRPRVRFSGGKLPEPQQISEMYDKAHHECFIANSVRTVVTVAPTDGAA